tara:strand:- start:540 stop:1265 length:726 start_codon:yes stop_codon:yes gene_type:complete
MRVVILAGGLGTRLPEYTKKIPKPMVKVAGSPIITHIMKHYIKFGFNDFIIATGYKGNYFEKYFRGFKKNGLPFKTKIFKKSCTITIVKTGLKTLTGGRLKRVRNYLRNDKSFMFTYGDGISNVNLRKLEKFHNNHNKIITVSAVRPPARFGELKIKNKIVKQFKEKPQTSQGWINGGFFVAKKNFLNLISNDKTILEKKPLESVAKKNQLMAFQHKGFWKCMDTKRDRDVLNDFLKKRKN